MKKINVDLDAVRKRAAYLFLEERYACSEAVLTAMNEALGSPLSEEAMRVATGFRGGMGDGDVCGAISGGIMVLGLVMAPDYPGTPSPELKEAAKALRARFAAHNDALDCADLTARFPSMNDPARRVMCGELVEGVVSDLVDIFDKSLS
ncbi:C-GCAxxG-C-C family protein [Synergistaceae bacterium OttesenSCG-928-I11]|nr:C-GCAxxG-C-C family protein [Synergistaceae bacterium OttesenSCG-928-I11]